VNASRLSVDTAAVPVSHAEHANAQGKRGERKAEQPAAAAPHRSNAKRQAGKRRRNVSDASDSAAGDELYNPSSSGSEQAEGLAVQRPRQLHGSGDIGD